MAEAHEGVAIVKAPKHSNYLPSLDGWRAIAIVWVLVGHGQGWTVGRFSDTWLRQNASYGVDLFFALSGFLICGRLLDEEQRFGGISLRSFYTRRLFRIQPAAMTYLAVVSILLLCGVLKAPWSPVVGAALMVRDFVPRHAGLWETAHFWSLSVEEHFYIFLPLLLLFMIRRNPTKPFARLPIVFAAIAVFCLACRFAVGWRQDGHINFWSCVFPTHLRIDGLMFGVLICYFKRFQPRVFQWMASWPGGWVVIAAAVAVLSIFPIESRQMHTWGFTLLYFAFGFVVAKAVNSEGPRPIRWMSYLLARIGVYSYSIYLWQMFFVWKVLAHLHIASPMLLYWTTIGGAILFGIAAAKIIEMPALRFRDRFFPSVSKPLTEPVLVRAS